MKLGLHKLTVTILAVAAIVGTANIASAAGSNVTLTLKDVDVADAIESMFRGSGRNYTLEPGTSVTLPSVMLTDVPFDAALKSITKMAGLTYRKDGNVYLITKKQVVVETQDKIEQITPTVEDVASEDETTIDKVALNHTGAGELLSMMSGQNNGGMGGYGGMMGGMGGYGGGMMGGMMGGMGGMMGGMGGYGGGMMGGMGGYGGGMMGGMGGYGGRTF